MNVTANQLVYMNLWSGWLWTVIPNAALLYFLGKALAFSPILATARLLLSFIAFLIVAAGFLIYAGLMITFVLIQLPTVMAYRLLAFTPSPAASPTTRLSARLGKRKRLDKKQSSSLTMV